MSADPNIDEIVTRLEGSWMQPLADFGRSMALSNPRIVAATFSQRHAEHTHSFGLCCHPAQSDVFDPRAVALIVTVIALDRQLSVKGYVQWQAPSLHQEGETAIYDSLEEMAARFDAELQGLLSVLAGAVARGVPPVVVR